MVGDGLGWSCLVLGQDLGLAAENFVYPSVAQLVPCWVMVGICLVTRVSG